MPMGGKRRGKSRQHTVSSEADEPAKKSSTCNPNVEWETCNEQQLENIIRKKLEDLYRDALSRLVSMLYDEDAALKGLLVRGYCVGIGDCLTNVVLNSLECLNDVVEDDPQGEEEEEEEETEEEEEEETEEEEEDQPQPFLNLELLVEFNLQFMVYILQKYRPNLNRTSACRCILMNDLNLNRAILMDANDTTEMLSNLNLDDDKEKDCDNVDKDRFLALEIREMLNNLNVVDDSVSEDTKDMMIADSQKKIDDLEEQLKERIRWATEKLAQARRNQATPKLKLMKEIQLFHEYTKNMLCKKHSKVSSINNELDNADFFFQNLVRHREDIKAEISALKLIESENMEKCLELSTSKKKKKNWEKQIVKLEEEMAMEKEKISEWEQKLVETEAAVTVKELDLRVIMKEREVAVEELEKEKRMIMERWTIFKPMVNAVHSRAYESIKITMDTTLKVEPKEEVHAKSPSFSKVLSILSKNTKS